MLHRITKFTNVRNITLFFPDNFGNDTSIVRFIGFKGEWSEVRRCIETCVALFWNLWSTICGMIDQTRSNHNRLVRTGVEKRIGIALIMNVVYEASANPADHKTPSGENKMNFSIQ